jgi:uncharacterized protein YutE (UPF0331/DUF86 family)
MPDISLEALKNNVDTQDIVLHNLQLAIQGCVDIGAHIISDEGWGVAGSFSEIFYILQEKHVITPDLAEKMIAMVGFRNILVHEYETIRLDIVYRILKADLDDIEDFLLAVADRFNL